jgi:HK97 gp10 family phage protein
MDEGVIGIQELLGKLSHIESTVLQRRIVARAVRAGCEPIRERAEELAPMLTGRLKESIMTTVTEQSATEAIGKIGPARFGFYGTFEEFGTARQSADPFLRPAYDEKIDEAQRIMGEVLADEIEKAAKQ